MMLLKRFSELVLQLPHFMQLLEMKELFTESMKRKLKRLLHLLIYCKVKQMGGENSKVDVIIFMEDLTTKRSF